MRWFFVALVLAALCEHAAVVRATEEEVCNCPSGFSCAGEDRACTKTCMLQKETGRCRAYFERFYFNTKTGECETFVWGGCGGNENNYKSIEECRSKSVACTKFEGSFPPSPRKLRNKGKMLWTELVGIDGTEAKKIVKSQRPDLKSVHVLSMDSPMTMDYREDRVRIMVDSDGNVASAPRIG